MENVNVQPDGAAAAPAPAGDGHQLPAAADPPQHDYTLPRLRNWIAKLEKAVKEEREQRCRSLVDKLFCAFKFGPADLKTSALDLGVLGPLSAVVSAKASDIMRYKAFRALGQLCFGSAARCRTIAEDIDVLRALRDALAGGHKMAKLNALGTLNNLASFSPDSHHSLRFLVPLVLRALDGNWSDQSSSAKKIRGLCCKTLHNLACNTENHGSLLKHGTIPPLLNVIALRSQELPFSVVAAALTICALAGHEGTCPALATLQMCATGNHDNVAVLLVRCFEAVLEDNPDPNDVNVFHKDWKIAQGLSILTARPDLRGQLLDAGLAEMLHRGLARPGVDRRFVQYGLTALWNLQPCSSA